MAYRNYRPYRANYAASTEPRSTTCTAKQHDLIVRLVAQIGEAMQTATPESVANAQQQVSQLTDLPRLLSEAWGEVGKSDTSHVIDMLIAVQRTTVAVPGTAPQYPGLPAHQRVMPTRFGGKCRGCGAATVAGTDLAVQVAGAWSAWCQKSANTDPDERVEEAEAKAAEAKAAAAVAAERLRLLNGVALGLARKAFDAMNMNALRDPMLRFAVPSVTGNNDLDFFTVSINSYRGQAIGVRVRRVIGGHADQPISLEQAAEALKRLTDGDIRAAALRYGQELGECCRCGRHLTDDESRAAGIGPSCANK